MLRVWRIAVGPALFAVAGLVGVASHAGAQPPDRRLETQEIDEIRRSIKK